MKGSRFREEQIPHALGQAETGTLTEVCLATEITAYGLHPNFPPFISRDRRLIRPPGAELLIPV